MNIGTNETLRARLRLTIHRGGVGQRPNRLSATAPVKTDETITSGMVMTLVRNSLEGRNEWVKGLTVDSLPNTFYIAVDDSKDGDVVAAGKTGNGELQGLSVRGDYEVSTSAYKTGTTYHAGDALTPDGSTGNLKKATEAGQIVIAHVVKDFDGPVDLGATYTDLLPDPATTVSSGVQGGVFVRSRETNAQDLTRLRIELVPPYKFDPS